MSKKIQKNNKDINGKFIGTLFVTSLLSVALCYMVFGLGMSHLGLSSTLGSDGQTASVGLLAQRPSLPPGGNGGGSGMLTNPLRTDGSLAGFLEKLLGVVIMLGSIVIVLFIIMAGFKYVTAGGDEKQIAAAHKQLLWTAIGAAVLLGARVISMVIQNTVKTLS